MVAYYQPSEWRLSLDTQWYLSNKIILKLALNLYYKATVICCAYKLRAKFLTQIENEENKKHDPCHLSEEASLGVLSAAGNFSRKIIAKKRINVKSILKLGRDETI